MLKNSLKAKVLLVCLLLCVLLFTACGGGNEASPPAGSDTDANAAADAGEAAGYADDVHLILDMSIGVLNFQNPAGTGGSANAAYRLIQDTLVWSNEDGTFESMLATDWETEDYQTWIFHLRDDVTFHNGDKFTAKDVIYTCDSGKASPGSTAFDNWNHVDTITAEDDYTLKMVLTAPNADFLHHISLIMTGILSERAITEDPEKGYWIGTGAYKVSGFSTNDYVTFERYDDYWGELPKAKTQTWSYIPEMATRTMLLQDGTYQAALGISESDFPLFESDPNFKLVPYTLNNPNALFFNMEDPITGDKNFRLACASALNKEDISIFTAADWAIPATEDGAIWGKETGHRNTGIPDIAYDPEKAKEYLAASSYNGEEVEISATAGTNAKTAEAVQEQLAQVGINTRIHVMDMPSFSSYTQWADNKAQMMVWINLMNLNPSGGYRVNFYPGSMNNRSHYDNPKLAEMIDTSRTIIDEAERDTYFKEMQQIVADDIPEVNLFWRTQAVVCDKNIEGMFLPPSAMYDFRYMALAK
jgi:peptide/nickel transport system substrate-binding protein